MTVDKKVSKRNIIILVLLGIIMVAILTVFSIAKNHTNYPVFKIEENWTVHIGGSTYEDIRLDELDIGVANEREVYVMTNTLPLQSVPSACIRTRTTHSSIVVHVGGEMIYQDGPQYVAADKMSPSYYHYIELPDDYAGKKLEIHLWANESNAFSVLEPVIVGNIHDMYLLYLHNNGITIIMAMFFTMMGILLLFVFVFLWMNTRMELRVFFSALISFLVGVYLLSFFKISNFFNDAPGINGVVEYLMLFLMPGAFMAFIGTTQEGTMRKVCAFFTVIDFVIAAATLFLHIMDFVHINRFVTMFHILIVAESLLVLQVALIVYLKRRSIGAMDGGWMFSDKVLMAGFLIMVAGAVAEVLKFNYLRYYVVKDSAYENLSMIMIGALVFLVSLIINFFFYHIERIYADDMMLRLSGLAYTDPLTDTANRSRCEEIMEKIEREGEPCTVISLDIDHLKDINDRFGHVEGDRYLSNMADILNRCFADADLVGRMGGDEFIVIYKGIREDHCENELRKVDEAVAQKNAEGDILTYDISYGCATSSEGSATDVRTALALADSRMYEVKRAKHAEVV